MKIENGDIVELIPGHYFYKYVTLEGEKKENLGSNKQKRNSDERSGRSKGHVNVGKKSRDESEVEPQAEGSKKVYFSFYVKVAFLY